MDYNSFVSKNNRNKKILSRNKFLCISGSVRKHDCKHEIYFKYSKNRLYGDNICNLVLDILKGNYCLSNPSVLRDWDFSQIKMTKVTKTTYNNTRIKNIVSNNMKSLNAKVVLHEPYLVLYHGSRDGIVGNIRPDLSRGNCDFGTGFYTGDFDKQAKLLVKYNGKVKLIYKLGVNLDGLNVYDFGNNIMSWVLYVACERGKINIDKYPKLYDFVNKVRSYDVVVGLIADDEMFQAFNEFVSDAMTLDGLAYCLTKVDLGHQYVFKTERACNRLRFLNIEKLNIGEYKSLTLLHDSISKEKSGIIEHAKDTYYTGKRIRELLRGYA